MTPAEDLTKTGVERMIDAEFDERMMKVQRAARKAEDRGFYVALGIAGLYGTAEVLIYTLVSLGKVTPVDAPVPWLTLALFVGCIIPKILGRATGGQIWIILANGFVAMFSRGKSKAGE